MDNLCKTKAIKIGGKKLKLPVKGRKLQVLRWLAKTGRQSAACERANVPLSTHYGWLRRDPIYKSAFQEVRRWLADALEDSLLERAVDGVEQPVYWQGSVCGTRREYSDALGMFFLKGLKPETYGDRLSINQDVRVSVDDARTRLLAMVKDNPWLGSELRAMVGGGAFGVATGQVAPPVAPPLPTPAVESKSSGGWGPPEQPASGVISPSNTPPSSLEKSLEREAEAALVVERKAKVTKEKRKAQTAHQRKMSRLREAAEAALKRERKNV